MSPNDIRSKLKPIFEDVLNIDLTDLADELSAKDIEEWDSLSNVRLMVSIERAFKIRFSAADVDGLKNVGDLIRSVAAKTATG